MRAARVGPIHGRPSIVATPAVSRSTGTASRFGCDAGRVVVDSRGATLRTVRDRAPPDRAPVRASLTRAICWSSARTSAGVGSGWACRDLTTRATTPSAAMAAMTTSARRSAGVEGMHRKCRCTPEVLNPGYAHGAFERRVWGLGFGGCTIPHTLNPIPHTPVPNAAAASTRHRPRSSAIAPRPCRLCRPPCDGTRTPGRSRR